MFYYRRFYMENKVLLILIDGLRPDALAQCEHPFLYNFMKDSCSYSFNGQSVMPSITLPCHMSLFHSVTPDRHGTMNNTYVPPTHKLDGLCDILERQKKKCAFFYTWAQLRDLCRPGALAIEEFRNYFKYFSDADCAMCDRTIRSLKEEKPDFIFYYTGHTDEVAHKYGWMSPEYMDAIALASQNVEKIIAELPEEYSVVITADHGGHARTHGLDIPEDMTIPIGFYGSQWEKGKELESVGLLNLAPTITTMLGCEVSEDWDGVSLL